MPISYSPENPLEKLVEELKARVLALEARVAFLESQSLTPQDVPTAPQSWAPPPGPDGTDPMVTLTGRPAGYSLEFPSLDFSAPAEPPPSPAQARAQAREQHAPPPGRQPLSPITLAPELSDNDGTVNAALERFPRVLQRITLSWGDAECDTILSDLIIDDRGGRQGFPADVVNELLFLTKLARIINPPKPQPEPARRPGRFSPDDWGK